MDYNAKSCNALEKPFYRPVEAALRWCGLIDHEAAILVGTDKNGIPKTSYFPQWPCLQANTEKILDAIMHGDIPHGRDGHTVATSDNVAKDRLTVRHTDLRDWMAKHYPDQKPAFLFDEIERKTHTAINAEAFHALQVDLDAARAELEKTRAWAAETIREMDALRGERDSLRAMVDKANAPGGRDHVSDKLARMNQASLRFWGNADRDDRGTHPDNAMVADWLINEEKSFTQTLADKAATIIRPKWAPTGRKPEQ